MCCLKVTASKQIKQFASLFNNIFGVIHFRHPFISSHFFFFSHVMTVMHSDIFSAENVTKNLIGTVQQLTITYCILLILSNKRKGLLSTRELLAVSGWKCCVMTIIISAKVTIHVEATVSC